MLNHEHFAVALARAVETVRDRPDAIDDQKVQLRALVALTGMAGATLRLADGALAVEDTAVPAGLPGVRTLVRQMTAHRVQEVRIAHQASAADLLGLLRALAGDAPLPASSGATVAVLAVREDQLAPTGRPVSPTEAFEVGPILAAAGEAPPASRSPLTELLERLNAQHTGPDTLDLASRVAQLILAALDDDRIEEAVDAVANLVRLEDDLPDGSPRRSFGIVLRRLLTSKVLRRLAPMALDARHRDAAIQVLRRAGGDGTEILVLMVGEANSLAERRAYFDALRAMAEGVKQVLHLLEHHEWAIVRNVVELAGELKMEEAIPALGKALGHHEPRVRRAAAGALARIGTAATIEHLRRGLREDDRDMRMAVAQAVAGRKAASLAVPLLLAAEQEQDVEALREYCRALGRIGSPDALQGLIRMAQPGGRFLKRKPAAPRLAAVEGLKAAGGSAALGTLDGLAQDADKEVRQAAERAAREVRAGPPSEA